MTTKHFEVQLKEVHETEFHRFFQVPSEEEGHRCLLTAKKELFRLAEITTTTETRVIEAK